MERDSMRFFLKMKKSDTKPLQIYLLFLRGSFPPEKRKEETEHEKRDQGDRTDGETAGGGTGRREGPGTAERQGDRRGDAAVTGTGYEGIGFRV